MLGIVWNCVKCYVSFMKMILRKNQLQPRFAPGLAYLPYFEQLRFDYAREVVISLTVVILLTLKFSTITL